MGREPGDVDTVLDDVLGRLAVALELPDAELLAAWSARDVLAGREVSWERPGRGAGGTGVAVGVDEGGRLRVRTAAGIESLDAGEVHLTRR
jgi:BirA family biotin operon repressor/biotin-[acetyl-CoA-carboxylase] ligase